MQGQSKTAGWPARTRPSAWTSATPTRAALRWSTAVAVALPSLKAWITWTEIAPPERISLLHGESRGDPNAVESVVAFAPEGAATRIEVRTVFPTKELRDDAVDKYHASSAPARA